MKIPNMILNILIFLASLDISLCSDYNASKTAKDPGFISYDGYSLFTTTPTEVHHLKFLKSLENKKYINLIYWRKPVKLYYDVQFILPRSDREMFMERAHHYNLNVTVLIEDLQDAFNNQTVRKYLRLKDNSFNWENYHSLEDIYQWLSDLAMKYPNSTYLQSIGKSIEGRDIYVFVIKNSGASKKVMIEGEYLRVCGACRVTPGQVPGVKGIHGDEWISVEFVTYLVANLLQPNSSDIRHWAQSYIWFIVPVLNPDGFFYSHTKDRLWRKNRRVLTNAFGVDLDRNFNYNFGAHSTSKDPKDDEYCGTNSFSEPETLALRNFIRDNYRGLRFYFSFHAYGQKIILPYGDRVKHMDDYSEMENYGQQAIVEMYRKTGVKYKIGTFYDSLGYKVSGDSASWVKKTYRIKYVMTFLLRDTGEHGHALPADQILPTCTETLRGLHKVMTASPRYVRHRLFGNSASNAFGFYTYTVAFLFCLNKLFL